ncbi:MAG: ATP-binding cassette domain-containing protein, partial [Nitrosomonas sp.]|nr:ATP-binding cassette domain-containing protein [Nitrosomonas sp.]
MSSEVIVSLRDLGKCYHLYERPRDRLLQMLTRGRRRFYREHWALQGVNLELCRGESLGIIGRNGAGKSTLLELICGTLAPTTGQIAVHGRVAALLELGSG